MLSTPGFDLTRPLSLALNSVSLILVVSVFRSLIISFEGTRLRRRLHEVF